MDREEIFYNTQQKLIKDLISVVYNARENYKSKIYNPWVFDYFAQVIGGLQPINLSFFEYNRGALKASLNKVLNEQLSLARNLFEIKAEEVNNFTNIVENLCDLIYSRAKAEFSSLESKISEYDNSKQFIEKEFYKSKAFNSKEEHQKWLKKFLGNLKTIFDCVENKSQTLTQKKNFGWKIKLAATKIYLKTNYGIELKREKLAEDISIMRKAILDNYLKYEKRLIDRRYSKQKSFSAKPRDAF